MRISDWSSDVCSSDLMARAFKAEMGELAAEFTQYIADWSDQRIAKDWGAFGRETGPILDALHNRIRRENELLYPLCEVASQADIVRRSEEHTSELQSLMRISYAVFCLKKKRNEKYKCNTKIN